MNYQKVKELYEENQRLKSYIKEIEELEDKIHKKLKEKNDIKYHQTSIQMKGKAIQIQMPKRG